MTTPTTYETKFQEAYARLNPEQKRAVDTIEGPVVVKAGPGTGKTQILTLRIANILRTQGADMAENILALTFTNAGVRAMRERLAGTIGSDAYRVGIFTFHSFAEHVIKTHPEVFAKHLVSSPATDVDRFQIVESILAHGEFTILKPFAAPTYHVRSILHAIDELKRDHVTADSFRTWNNELKQTIESSEDSYYKRNGKGFSKGDFKPDSLKPYNKNLELVEIYEAYQEALALRGLYDFTDMIVHVIDAMATDSDFLYSLQEQYQYVLVDEHQDTNTSQSTLIELLASSEHLDGRPNIFTVGDDKQAIYRFQGASQENFANFETQYKDVEVISLVQNYRSGQQVLDSSHSLIQQDEQGVDHQGLTAQRADSVVHIHEFNTYADELHFVAQDILQKKQQGVEYNDMVVMYRENRHTRDIQRVFAQYSIPAVVMAKENILDTPLVYKILLVLRVAENPTDNKALAELLYSDVFEIELYTAIKIIERFRRNKRDKVSGEKHIFKIIQDKKILKELDIRTQQIDVLLSLAQQIQLAHTCFLSMNFMLAFDEVVRSLGILQAIVQDPDSHAQLRYYERLYQEFRSLDESNKKLEIKDVLAHIQTLEEYNITLDAQTPSHTEGVHLMTAHKSKGLEYAYVYITNLVNKTWGNKASRDNFTLPVGSVAGDNDDERRLLFVGVTRAMRECYMSFSKTSLEGKETEASLFLYDFDSRVVSWSTHTESVPLPKLYTPVNNEVIHHSLFDQTILRELHKTRPLSVTALNNYIDCPARYLVNNLLQIPASYTRSLMYGSVMHAALELYFRDVIAQNTILGSDVLLAYFTQELGKQNLNDDEYKDLYNKGIESLTVYYEYRHSTWSPKVQNEMRIHGVELGLESDTIVLTGVLDRVDFQTERHVNVFDYKTGKTFSEKNTQQKEALERQIVFYSLLLSLYRDGEYIMDSGTLDFIEPNKKSGEIETHTQNVTKEDRQALVQEIQTMYQEIQTSDDFLSKRCKKPDCDACMLLEHLH